MGARTWTVHKLLIIKRIRSAIVYKMVAIHKLLNYTGYALQLP